jgi:uncharacterized protein (DUF2147 family)
MKRDFVSACVGLLIAGLVASAVPAAAQQQRGPGGPPTPAGLWEQVGDDGRVGGWFQIYDRGDGIYEGKLVKIFPKPGETTNPICSRCPGDQRGKPSLGLVMIKGMTPQGRSSFVNGSILDPRDGSVYNARMDLSPDGQRLALRGYLGIEMFGQTQTWRRLPESAMAEVQLPNPPPSPPMRPPQRGNQQPYR